MSTIIIITYYYWKNCESLSKMDSSQEWTMKNSLGRPDTRGIHVNDEKQLYISILCFDVEQKKMLIHKRFKTLWITRREKQDYEKWRDINVLT